MAAHSFGLLLPCPVIEPTDFVLKDRRSAETCFPRPDEPANPGRRTAGSNLYAGWESPSPPSTCLRFAIVKLLRRHVFALHVTRFFIISRSHSTRSRNSCSWDCFSRRGYSLSRYTRLRHRTVTLRNTCKVTFACTREPIFFQLKVVRDPLNRDARLKWYSYSSSVYSRKNLKR